MKRFRWKRCSGHRILSMSELIAIFELNRFTMLTIKLKRRSHSNITPQLEFQGDSVLFPRFYQLHCVFPIATYTHKFPRNTGDHAFHFYILDVWEFLNVPSTHRTDAKEKKHFRVPFSSPLMSPKLCFLCFPGLSNL